MLVELLDFFSDSYGPLRVFDYLSFRAIFATLTALLVSLILGPRFINKMQAIEVGQVIREKGPATHLSKKGTPTMGGTLILASIFISTILWGDLENRYLWVALGVTTLFGALGWVDDLYKLRFESSKGLSPLAKIFWQSLIALTAVIFLFYSSENISETSFIVPFFKNISIPMGFGFIILSYLVIIGSSNAVNLTDGLDGLAILPSLALGGSLGTVGIITKHEIVLAITGGLFVLEAVSVIVQVLSYKITGKRVFKMAPIHHHYELKGWPEPRVIVRFWIITFMLVLIGLVTLKLR